MNTIRAITFAMTLVTAACMGVTNSQTVSAIDPPDGTRIVLINGDIEQGHARRFFDLAEGHTVSMVALNSDGGDFKAALVISIYIKKHRLRTYLPSHAVCTSACGMIFLSGAERTAHSTARVGLHPPNLGSPLGENREHWPIVAHQWYQWMVGCGVPPAVVERAAKCGPCEMWWLNDTELAATRVVVKDDQTP